MMKHLSLLKKICTVFAVSIIFLASPALAEIRIGVALPLSGLYAPLSQQIINGAKLALEKTNISSGALNEKISLVILDDKCSAQEAKEIANQLVGQKVIAVIGHLCDRSSIEASEIYAKNKIIQISPASQNAALTTNRPNPKGGTYRLAPRNEQQATAIIDFLTNQKNKPSIALIYDGTAYGNAFKANLEKKFTEKPIFKERLDIGKPNYDQLANRLADSGATHIIIAALHLDATRLIRGLDKVESNAIILGGEAWVQKDFPALILEGNNNRQTLDQIYISFPPDDRKRPEAKNIVQEFQQKNIRPSGLTLRGYTALKILSEALGKAKTKEYDALIQILNSETFQTPLGTINFNNIGDASLKGYELHQWNGKTLEPLQ